MHPRVLEVIYGTSGARQMLMQSCGWAPQLGRDRIALVLIALAGASCDRAPARGPTDITTTSGSVPRPAAKPAPYQSADRSGYVDNAGRTSDELSRTEMSGMRATETGSDRPTGTPGSGLPLPIEPKVPPERPRPERGTSMTGAPSDAVVALVVEAICTRETSCGHVGDGRKWASGAICMDALRPQTRHALEQAWCPDDFDPNAVADCVSDLREISCERSQAALGSLANCEPRTLCMRR